jgi:hypothetical protein
MDLTCQSSNGEGVVLFCTFPFHLLYSHHSHLLQFYGHLSLPQPASRYGVSSSSSSLSYTCSLAFWKSSSQLVGETKQTFANDRYVGRLTEAKKFIYFLHFLVLITVPRSEFRGDPIISSPDDTFRTWVPGSRVLLFGQFSFLFEYVIEFGFNLEVSASLLDSCMLKLLHNRVEWGC